MKKTKRREFLRKVTAFTGGMAALPLFGKSFQSNTLPYRTLGKTGVKVSIIGIGGYHVGDPKVSEDTAIEIIRQAIDRGVNFMDNAWTYKKGRSETVMGKALQDNYRDKVFLMTKLMARNVEDAKVQMETSLKRFNLDSVDLMQFHAIGNNTDDVDAIYNSGLIEWAEDQRSQGVFKYIGYTGHGDPKAHIDMIERGYPWDTVQMPLNIGDYHRNVSFERHVLPLATERNIGVIGMKSNGMGRLGKSGIASPTEGLRYTMSLPVSTVVSGIDSLDILEENLQVFEKFKSLTPQEKEKILAKAAGQSDVIEHYRRQVY